MCLFTTTKTPKNTIIIGILCVYCVIDSYTISILYSYFAYIFNINRDIFDVRCHSMMF